MTIEPTQNTAPSSGAKSSPVATADVSAVKPTTHPHEAIAHKAYEIWLSRGQQPGCDQKDWFEAELQLQQA